MSLIRPIAITPDMITACDVPENDHPDWNILNAPYATDDYVLHNHKIYLSLVDSNSVEPGTDGLKWQDEGYDNRHKMFDSKVGTQTSQADSFSITVKPGQIDSLAFLDAEATSIAIEMNDPVEGLVFSDTIDMIAKATVVDAYTYFVEPIILKDKTILSSLPFAYVNASINITVYYTGGTAKLGTLIFGLAASIGDTMDKPKVSIKDNSKKDTDIFGNFTVLERTYHRLLSAVLSVETPKIDDLADLLEEFRATPVVWIFAGNNHRCMITYGFYKRFDITRDNPILSECSLEIIGLAQ